jgi:hypothetical protein
MGVSSQLIIGIEKRDLRFPRQQVNRRQPDLSPSTMAIFMNRHSPVFPEFL